MSTPQATMIIGSLRKHEEAIAALYELFAEAVPRMTTFWKEIAREERAHACVIESLAELELAGAVIFKPDPFQTKAILESLEFMTNKRRQVDTEGIDELNALRVALELERSMLESRFFEIYEPNSASMRPELEELRRHTVEHRARIAAALAKRCGKKGT